MRNILTDNGSVTSNLRLLVASEVLSVTAAQEEQEQRNTQHDIIIGAS